MPSEELITILSFSKQRSHEVLRKISKRLAKIPKKQKVMSKSAVREHSLHSDFFSFD